MPELRWALIGLGLAFLGGLVIWEWRRSRRAPARVPMPEPAAYAERPRRVEPGIDTMSELRAPTDADALDVPVMHAQDPVPVAVALESAIDVPAAARGAGGEPVIAPPAVETVETAPIRWPPDRAERVLTLRVVGRHGDQLAGRALRIALDAAGFVPGPQTIYHLVEPDGSVLVSAANLVKPADLEPARMDAQHFRGVSLFTVLPGPLPELAMLNQLVTVARALAQRLDGVVQDEQGAEFDGVRFAALRQSLPGEAAP